MVAKQFYCFYCCLLLGLTHSLSLTPTFTFCQRIMANQAKILEHLVFPYMLHVCKKLLNIHLFLFSRRTLAAWAAISRKLLLPSWTGRVQPLSRIFGHQSTLRYHSSPLSFMDIAASHFPFQNSRSRICCSFSLQDSLPVCVLVTIGNSSVGLKFRKAILYGQQRQRQFRLFRV